MNANEFYLVFDGKLSITVKMERKQTQEVLSYVDKLKEEFDKTIVLDDHHEIHHYSRTSLTDEDT